jgi:hypothetical protein
MADGNATHTGAEPAANNSARIRRRPLRTRGPSAGIWLASAAGSGTATRFRTWRKPTIRAPYMTALTTNRGRTRPDIDRTYQDVLRITSRRTSTATRSK